MVHVCRDRCSEPMEFAMSGRKGTVPAPPSLNGGGVVGEAHVEVRANMNHMARLTC